MKVDSRKHNLNQLRKLMVSNQPSLAAYIIPSCDAHNSEYISACDERRAFITGFDGSAGTAIVTANHALLWTDCRYFLQSMAQMDENWTLMKDGQSDTINRGDWLAANLKSGDIVGVDPFLLTVSEWNTLNERLERSNIKLIGLANNLVDKVWGFNQPDRPVQPIVPLEMKFAGKSWEEKVLQFQNQMAERGVDNLVLSALDEIAWILNLRGSDIKFNPVFFSYVVISSRNVYFFVDKNQVTNAVTKHLKLETSNLVKIKPYEAISDYLSQLKNQTIWLSKHTSQAIIEFCSQNSNKLLIECSPVSLTKAIKNEVEIQGFINCHIKDAAALCSYFAWLEKEVPKGMVSEVSGAEKVAFLRSEMENFVGLSFATISSVGPHAAMNHYSPTPETDRPITMDEIYLVDSGGQYKDGTTDVTRTMHFGTPKDFEKDCFTRVLKGQISLTQAVFPNKIKGIYLDSLARQFLWEVGLDFSHGTGHGVGHYLNVHEGPYGIGRSLGPYPDDPGLQAGMVISNEPGYYKPGEFGIRIENLIHVVPANAPNNYLDRGYLTFEDLTLVPIQEKMIEPSLLTQKEIHYINQYHQKCRDIVGPLLKRMGKTEGYNWLIKETTPIG